MRTPKIVLLAALLAGCDTAPPVPTAASIDWSSVPVTRLRLAAGFFHPQQLVLPLGRPVRLVFDNGGGTTHDFVTALFAAVDQRPPGRRADSQNAGGQLVGKTVGGARVILQPAETVEYDIVPTTPGTYPVQTVMATGPGAIAPAAITIR